MLARRLLLAALVGLPTAPNRPRSQATDAPAPTAHERPPSADGDTIPHPSGGAPPCDVARRIDPARAPCLSAHERARLVRVSDPLLDAAAEASLDPALLLAVAFVESRFDPRARGPRGARGLLQIMPRTGRAVARALGRRYRPLDPRTNAAVGAHLLRRLLDRFGRTDLALVAYNRGPAAAVRAARAGVGPRAHRYVDRVLTARSCLAAALVCPRAPNPLPPPAARGPDDPK